MARERAGWSGPAGCGRGAATRGAAPWRPPAAAEAAFAEGRKQAGPGISGADAALRREIPSPRPRRKTLARRVACVRRGAEPTGTGGEDWPTGGRAGRQGPIEGGREVKGCRDGRRLWIPPALGPSVYLQLVRGRRRIGDF
jgi:hypothetical protein